MNPRDPEQAAGGRSSRRAFLQQGCVGLGGLALSSWLAPSAAARPPSEEAGAKRAPGAMHRARAKSVIYLHMAGSPPQHDLLDYKPELNRLDGTPCPREFFEGKRLAFTRGHPELLGSPHPFVQAGRNGTWVSSLLPNFAQVIDKTCIVRSMHTDQFNHAPAQLLLYTGSARFGGASLGSWVSWGLGSLNDKLPTFVVLGSGGTDPSGGKSLWGSGFLPSRHQGVRLRGQGDPILYASNPPGLDRAARRRSLDALRDLNEEEWRRSGDPETRARIEQYELAFRMQSSVPTVMDIAREEASTLALYGAEPGQASFANNCLLARRLVEEGVRFVQLYDWGWDVHGTGANDDLLTQLPKKCLDVDRPIAGLLIDLERRGLLEETLVVWGGEFGRTSMREARNGSKLLGRDHHPDCFTIWMAGGGVRAGQVYGETDELGYTIARDPVDVRDLQATILHLLGLEAERLRYPYLGLNQRLIGPAEGPRVISGLLA